MGRFEHKQTFSVLETAILQCPVSEISIIFVAIKMGRRQDGPSRTGT
jgi:hypothetical protein